MILSAWVRSLLCCVGTICGGGHKNSSPVGPDLQVYESNSSKGSENQLVLPLRLNLPTQGIVTRSNSYSHKTFRGQGADKVGEDTLMEVLADESSQVFSLSLKFQLSPDSLLLQYLGFLETCAQRRGSASAASYTLAEAASCRHQLDILAAVSDDVARVPAALTQLGFNHEAFLFGVIHSDLGKLQVYKDLLTKPSVKSDLFLETITGRNNTKSARFMRQVLGGKTLLNPRFSPADIRKIFVELPVLQGFFHELPGIADAIVSLELGIFDETLFKEALKANLFHNGPRQGFWGKLANEFIPAAIQSKNLNDEMYFLVENTPFEPESFDSLNSIKPEYPSPLSFEGLLHNLFDRVSQSTKGGLIKIYFELGKMAVPLHARLLELQTATFPNTILQVQALQRSLSQLEFLSEGQRDFLWQQADDTLRYLTELQAVFTDPSVLSWDKSSGELSMAKSLYLSERHSIEPSETRLWKALWSDEKNTYVWPREAEEEIGQALTNLLESYEALKGNPMKLRAL